MTADKELRSLKKELKDQAKILAAYREQLLQRHTKEPLKSPPLFLLQGVISTLERLAEK